MQTKNMHGKWKRPWQHLWRMPSRIACVHVIWLEFHTWFHAARSLCVMCNIINKTWNGYYISYHTPNFRHVKPNINLNDNGMEQHSLHDTSTSSTTMCALDVCDIGPHFSVDFSTNSTKAANLWQKSFHIWGWFTESMEYLFHCVWNISRFFSMKLSCILIQSTNI